MTITESDVPRVAAAIRVAGELFEAHGALMLSMLDDWRAGAKAANLDPDTRGNRWEDCSDPPSGCCPHAQPADPTGEAAVTARRLELATDLQTRLDRLVRDAQWLRDTAHVLAPIVPPSTMNGRNTEWCDNCLRVGLKEPRHRGADCRACYDFRLEWNARRPISLIRDKRYGTRRMSEKAVKAALEADGVILKTVGGVTKAVEAARGRKPNQNQKKRKC